MTAFMEPLTVADRRAWFDEHTARHPIWVVEAASSEDAGARTVAGWCSLSPYRSGRAALRHVTEVSYYVADEHQRKEIGSALLDHAVEQAPALGYDALVAVLLGVNEASVGLLEKHGFEPWGRLPEIAQFGTDRYDHLIYGRHVGPAHRKEGEGKEVKAKEGKGDGKRGHVAEEEEPNVY